MANAIKKMLSLKYEQLEKKENIFKVSYFIHDYMEHGSLIGHCAATQQYKLFDQHL